METRTGVPRLRVGVTGHRWNTIARRAQPELERLLGHAFASLDVRFPGAKTLFCGMAEGTDLCAAAVRPAGWELAAILPLPPVAWRAHLARTAGPDDAALFDRLIADASVEVVSPGPEPAFEAAGIRLAAASDRLLAVWDGRPGLPGGVAEIVERCRAHGTPVDILPWPPSHLGSGQRS